MGNIATQEAFKLFCDLGADAIEIGIGAGSICTTRVIAGVGMPQLSTVIKCHELSKKYNVPLISDE